MKKQLLILAMCTIGLFTYNASNAQKADGGKKHANVLNLTADQQSKMKDIRKSEKTQAKAIKADSSLSADAKKQKLKDLHSGFSQQERAVLTPEQQAKQDSLRATHKHVGKGGKGKKGQMAFAKKLNLSDEQKQSMKSLHQAQKDKITAVKSNTALSDQEKRQQIVSIRKEGRQEFQKLLTPEQKSQIQQMRSSRKNAPSPANS